MATTVGDVQVVVRARLNEFRRELSAGAEAEGAKAGDKAGQAFNRAMTKVGAAAITGVFALAARGALELDGATRKAAASMGLADDEMAGLQSRIVSLFESNPTKGFTEIADTIAALKTNLGLSAEEAAVSAQAFLAFSQVTGQTGVAAVQGLDDVLDAFNLNASDSERVMDLLVVSHQKFGGSITDNQAALSKLAPALQAMNLTVDDGAALLNLFATTGLDASKATFALNTAVKNLKPGQNLNTLISQLGAIEDPTKRAQEAIKIFGARGGVALANALKPGITSLEDFKISTEDAAGATTEAAATINDSFQNKITSAFRTFIAGPLAELGPAVTSSITAVAGLATTLVAAGIPLDAATLKTKALGAAMKALPIIAIVAGFIEIIGKAQELGRVLGVIQMPEGFERNAVLIAELDKQIGLVSGALIQVPGQLQGLKDARQALIDLNNPVNELAVSQRAAAADAGQYAVSVDGVGIAVGGAAVTVDSAAESIALSMDMIGTATTENRKILEADFDAMLQKVIDSRDPSRAAMAAYNQALKDPLNVDERLIEIIAEIDRVAPDLVSEAPNVKAAAILYTKQLEDEFRALRDDALGFGEATGTRYASGLALSMRANRPRIGSELDEIRSLIATGSPPGPKSPLHFIDRWARETGTLYMENLALGFSNLAPIKGALSAIGGLTATMPSIAAPALAYADAGSGSAPAARVAAAGPLGSAAPDTINIDMSHSTFMGSQAEIERFARQIRPVLARDGERRLTLPTSG